MMASLSSEENGGHTAVDISPSDTLTSHAAADTVSSSSLENTVISSELDTEGLTMEINRSAAKASPARGSEPASSQAKPNGDPTSLCEPAQVNALNLNQTMFEDTEVRSADQHELVPTAGSSSCAVTKTSPQITTFEENNTSSSEKEMETEFLRLSLGFKCDIFTLEKRLRLEERSRDLAEENLKREISSCLKLLEVLSPLCEEDNQSHEIVKKLEKSLQFLSQHTSRVASRAEMLGAIHQESRISKAVEVMIHHVENLKRMYAKEHAELEELKEVIHQNECSSSSADRDDSLKVKLLPSLNTKPASLRRVSMPAYPRSIGTGLPMLHESFGGEKLDGKIHKRSNSWKLMASKTNDNRPTLQRFISTCARADPAEEASIAEDDQNTEKPEPITGDQKRKLSLLEKNPSRMKTSSVYSKLHVWASDIKSSFSTLNKTLLISVLIMLCLAALGSFLTGLSFHRPVDGAPVGTGDSWTSLQQLLWPYTGFRHNGQPPV
ncbi:hypothetical protein FKM82_011513 [Ascaphus truei]